MEKDKQILVSVFTSSNNALCAAAKSILENYKIEYFPEGEFNAYSSLYGLEIKVSEKDEKFARELLKELEEDKYYLPDKFNKKLKPYIGYLIIITIILLIAGMVLVFSLVK